jgi:2-oxoglutarate ferredoxin oxidoreductase subunit beta
MNNTLSYLRESKLPHIWCPGCGNGIVTGAIVRAIDKCNLDPNKTVIVSGIGCSSRASGYMNFDTLHTAHGRALGFATGIKMANPELNVIVISGDGDASAIGGNHLIHACRRNIDITLVIVNNNIYGMTSGQYSPLTPTGAFATTAVYGNIDRTFDLAALTEGAGATYVARSTVYHVPTLQTYIEAGIQNKGFSVIEAVSTCPTYFGRKNGIPDPADMLAWLKDNSTMRKDGVTEYDKTYVLGEFVKKTAPEYTDSYYNNVIHKAKGGAK